MNVSCVGCISAELHYLTASFVPIALRVTVECKISHNQPDMMNRKPDGLLTLTHALRLLCSPPKRGKTELG